MLYEVLVRQLYFAQEVINRFHFLLTGTPASVAGSFALASAFGTIDTAGVFPAGSPFRLMASVQNASLQYLEVQVAAMYSDTDFYTRPFPVETHGVLTGEAASPVLASGIQSNRITTAVRRGNKRFAGMTEEVMGAGGILTTPMLEQLQLLCDALNEPLVYTDEGTPLTFTSCVLSFERYVTPEGNPAYKQYETLSEQLEHAAVGVLWTPKTQVRTQTSRQYGRGR